MKSYTVPHRIVQLLCQLKRKKLNENTDFSCLNLELLIKVIKNDHSWRLGNVDLQFFFTFPDHWNALCVAVIPFCPLSSSPSRNPLSSSLAIVFWTLAWFQFVKHLHRAGQGAQMQLRSAAHCEGRGGNTTSFRSRHLLAGLKMQGTPFTCRAVLPSASPRWCSLSTVSVSFLFLFLPPVLWKLLAGRLCPPGRS